MLVMNVSDVPLPRMPTLMRKRLSGVDRCASCTPMKRSMTRLNAPAMSVDMKIDSTTTPGSSEAS